MAPSFKKDFTSFKVPKGIMDSNDKNSRVCVFSKPLCTAIFRQFGWDKGKTYRIPGRMFPDQQVVIYYIDDAFRIEKDRWLRPSEDNS